MKNNNLKLSLLLFLFTSQLYSYEDPIGAWPQNTLPVQYVFDNIGAPNGVVNSTANRNELIQSVNEWNQNDSLGNMVNITQGTVDRRADAYDYTNNINEIKFTSWKPTWPSHWDATNQILIRYDITQFPRINTPKAGSLLQRYESDIYFNPSQKKQFFVGESK